MQDQPINTEMLTARQAAAYLNVALPTLYSYTHLRKIRFTKPNGKKVYFAKADLDAYLNRNAFPSEEEIRTDAATRIVTRGR